MKNAIDNRFNNRARLVCYGPSQLPGVGDGGAGDNAGDEPRFRQEDLNKILAEDRRKHQAQIVKIQATLEETLTSKNLTTQERDSLASQLDEVKNSFKTVEERKASELRDREKALEAAKKEAADWKARHDNLTIEQQLQSAAVGNDCFNAAQLTALLRPKTELKPVNDPQTGKFTGQSRVVVVLQEKDESNQVVAVEHSPESAVRRLKELPEWQNMFKANMAGGVGSNSHAGVGGGKLDLRTLTPQQYQEIRQKNPELLGLRRDKRNRV